MDGRYLGKDPSRLTTQSIEESMFLKLMEEKCNGWQLFYITPSCPLLHSRPKTPAWWASPTNRHRFLLCTRKPGLHDTRVMQSDRAMLSIYLGKEKNSCILSTMHKSTEILYDAKKRVYYSNRTQVWMHLCLLIDCADIVFDLYFWLYLYSYYLGLILDS